MQFFLTGSLLLRNAARVSSRLSSLLSLWWSLLGVSSLRVGARSSGSYTLGCSLGGAFFGRFEFFGAFCGHLESLIGIVGHGGANWLSGAVFLG